MHGYIRCEKASAYLKKKGFKNVYQLKGGIINYLDVKKKDSLWSGDCFVFDNRVSIKHGLKPGNLKICPGCRNPIKLSERKSNFYEQGVSCPNCYNNLTNSQKQRFRMRQKQILTAKKHGKKFFSKENIEMNLLKDNIPHLVRKLALPAMVGMLFQNNIVDTFMLEKYHLRH